MTRQKIRMEYAGSKFWLIFWIIALFPVGLVLMLTAGRFEVNQQSYAIRYDGSRGWLCFWTVVCFPVAFLLLFLNGFALEQEDRGPGRVAGLPGSGLAPGAFPA